MTETVSPSQSGMPSKSVAGGISFMLFAMIMMTIMHVMVRLMGQELHPFEVAFFRNFFGCIALAPFIFSAGLSTLKTSRPVLHCIRGLTGTVAMLAWFYALSIVPLADVTALSFIGVVFTSIGAVIAFREKMGVRRWSAVAVSFIGMLIILRPGLVPVGIGLWLVLFATVMWSMSVLFVKELGRSDSATCIVAWMSLILTVTTAVPAIAVWQWPDSRQYMYLAAIGILATIAHLCMAKALQLADATVVTPFDFTRLIWATALGYMVFGEMPDQFTVIGGILIVSSAAYIMIREHKKGATNVTGARPAHIK